jgi:hypothetical protein
MKKILMSLVCCFTSLANAENLKCENSYPLFEKIIFEKMSMANMGTEQEIHDYSDKYDYSYLFNNKHLNQRYWTDKKLSDAEIEWSNNEWISQREYNKRIKKMAKDHEKLESYDAFYQLLPNKANVISKVGEICVVPIQTYFNIEDDNGEEIILEGMLIDHIFVKDPKNNEWRVLEYNRDISDQDFREFFPDFPDEIKNELNDGGVEAQDASSS